MDAYYGLIDGFDAHKECQRYHARKRITERYGLEGNHVSAIRDLIEKKDSKKIAVSLDTGKGRFIYVVTYLNKFFALVYDTITKEIATFLPKTVLSNINKYIYEYHTT